MRRLNELSHLDLCCLTFSLSTLHINDFPNDSFLKKEDDRCRLKFGAENPRAKTESAIFDYLVFLAFKGSPFFRKNGHFMFNYFRL